MPLPNQLPKLNFEGIDPVMQQWLNQLTDTVNTHSGYNGPVKIADHLDLGGNRVINIGPPVAATDALPSGVAEETYSAAALKPQLSPSGSQPMPGYRQMNNQSQREQVSSYLNDLMSSVPSANTLFPTITNVMGGVSVSVPSSFFTFADGSTVLLDGRTDLLSLPAQFAITNVTVAGGVVTITTATPSGLVAGQVATISGVVPAVYNGTFQLTSATPPFTLTYNNSGASGAYVSGGFVQTNGVYYYTVRKRSTAIILLGPFGADTAENRLQANFDSFQIVAVVVITADGGQVEQTGGGGSPIVGSPAGGAFF